MENKIENAAGPLVAQGTTAADGVLLDGGTVGVTHIEEAALRAKVDDTKKKNNEYQSAKKALSDSKKALDEAFQNALSLAMVTRDNLKPKLGTRYSNDWNEVGFVNATLMLPRSVPKATGLVSSMALFLEAHPELNIAGVATPEILTASFTALNAANTAVNQAKGVVRLKKEDCDAAKADLRKTLIGLRRELSLLIEPNDPRWLFFGFNVPSDLRVPQAPEGLTAASNSAGHALVNWTRPAGAERYHVYKQVVGVDAEPVRVATVRETSTTVSSLPSGAQVTFHVTALNPAGESLASQTVTITVA